MCSMIQTYCNLTSLDEPAIFNINQDQKHILNQLIQFASKNWEERKNWYQEHHQLAIKKFLKTRFVAKLWKKLKLPASSLDYVADICHKIKNITQDVNAPLDIQQNN